jgi:hypothetical protein
MPKPSPHAAQERCPYCSFQPTNMNDYCDEHRPKMSKPKRPTGSSPYDLSTGDKGFQAIRKSKVPR